MIYLEDLRPYVATRLASSPNHGPRKGSAILGVVLHATADKGNEAGSVSWMQNPKSEASAHLLVHRDGSVTRLVDDRRRAWHAGASEWRGSADVNGMTLGVEIANRNDGKEKYTDAQYERLAEIATHYCRQGLTLADFVSHAEVARPKGRKSDPKGFDWARFRRTTEQLLAAPAFDRRQPRPPSHLGDLVVEPITVPTRESVLRVAERAGIPVEILCRAAPVTELVLRGLVAGNEGVRAGIYAEMLAVFQGFREGRCEP